MAALVRHIAAMTILAMLCGGCLDVALDPNGTAADPEAAGDGGAQAHSNDSGDNDGAPDTDGQAAPTDDAPDMVTEPRGSDGGSGAAAVRSRHYGPTGAACPSGATRVSVGQSIQQTIDRVGRDGVICVTPGRYRLRAALRPKWGSTLHFQRGAVLDGSKRITNWSREGRYWVAGRQRQSFEHGNVPCTERPVACEVEDLFRDGEPLRRVLRRDAVRSDQFFFDERADKMYVVDDPRGHRLEAPVTATAIEANGARDVTVRGATIEKFAKNGIEAAPGWVVANNEIRYVHSHGLRVTRSTRVEGNYIHHAGNMGIFGQGDRMTFIGNQLSHNNYLGLDYWHAGATKIWGSAGVTVRGNWSHHNTGDGWWFDTDNVDVLVEENLFERNKRFGLFYETSFDARVRRNIFANNGTAATGDGAGMYINTAKNVKVKNNAFTRNANGLVFVSMDRGSSSRGRHETTGLLVDDNRFVLNSGYTGVAHGKRSIYQARANNRFTGNRYVVSDRSGDWWRWSTVNANRHFLYSWAQWQRAGQDRDGSLATR